ncbi:MAG: hypothetical protein IPP48_07140 [Chitinophagaceae bacterium]|nr:hypothetical protein [Chitinophagaceae bacterium]
MQIIPVNNPTTAKQFLQVAVNINKNDTNWIRPLDKDINDVFDKEKNKAFRFGEIERWLLQNDNGEFIGRVAAFVNKKYKNKGDDVAVGGMGFFECVNNQEAANKLFDTAKNWLQQKGMEAMDGPINFGERDKWWGLVTQGFHPPLYCLNYNPPYYVNLFENYGFKVFFNQICFGFNPQAPLSKKTVERHALVAQDPDFSFATIKKNSLQKFANDFAIVYNKAWAGHGGLKEMAKEQVLVMFNKMKPVMDENIVYFAYYKNEPIGMFLNLPDLNQYFKHMNGKFGLWQKLKFVFLQKFKPTKKFNGLVFGVVPEWQGKGIDAYLIGESAKIVQAPPKTYTEYEMQWIGDFNPKMVNVAENFGDTFRSRNLATYRYLFDRNKEFARHPTLS